MNGITALEIFYYFLFRDRVAGVFISPTWRRHGGGVGDFGVSVGPPMVPPNGPTEPPKSA